MDGYLIFGVLKRKKYSDFLKYIMVTGVQSFQPVKQTDTLVN